MLIPKGSQAKSCVFLLYPPPPPYIFQTANMFIIAFLDAIETYGWVF